MNLRGKKKGFTLVEIIIVVSIIGLLAALGIPKMLNASIESRSKCFASEINYACNAFVQFVLDNDEYPADGYPGTMPPGMASYLSHFKWSGNTTIGGKWDWDYEVFGVKAAVSVYQPKWTTDQMRKIDALIDNGDLRSGNFRQRSGGYMLVIEE